MRAPTVAPTPTVMLFGFGQSDAAPKKGGKKVVKKAVKKTVRQHAPAPPARLAAHRPSFVAHDAPRTAQVKKKVVKKVAKKPAKKLAKGARPMQGGAKTGAGPLGTAKSFFSFGNDGNADSAASQDNWVFQARVHTAQPTLHMHCSFATEDPRRQARRVSSLPQEDLPRQARAIPAWPTLHALDCQSVSL